MKKKVILSIVLSVIALLFAVALGSVYVSPEQILNIIGNKLFGIELSARITDTAVAMIWSVRLPRAMLAFVVGGMLSVSGAVMQSVLRNPLASSYTLGVSSGASLGAGMVILLGVAVPVIGELSLLILGFIFGLGTIFLAIAFASRLGGGLENNTIILTGMVISLFTNALVTLMSALGRHQVQRLVLWQMGSFSLKDWSTVFILLPIFLIGVIFIIHYNRELDMLTFGEEQAKAMGVNVKTIKWILLIVAAALTGSTFHTVFLTPL